MPKAITACALKTQLGGILRELRENERFVIFRRNLPVGVLMSIRDYVRKHSDQYEDIEDFVDTLLEETDSEFQESLRKGVRAIKRGRYFTHTELNLAVANKKLPR